MGLFEAKFHCDAGPGGTDVVAHSSPIEKQPGRGDGGVIDTNRMLLGSAIGICTLLKKKSCFNSIYMWT
jgi:hypothetical protein